VAVDGVDSMLSLVAVVVLIYTKIKNVKLKNKTKLFLCLINVSIGAERHPWHIGAHVPVELTSANHH
jgi:hypothetical protein